MNKRIILLILVILVGLFLFYSLSQSKDSEIETTDNETIQEPEEELEESDFSEWEDVCIESVKAIAVGHTKPFSPWSPDGEYIAYSNVFEESMGVKINEPEGVYVIKYDGTEKTLVAPDGVRPSFGRYQWQIVYGMNGTTGALGYKNTSEEDIWIVNFDGTENRALVIGEEDNRMKIYGGTSITYDGKYVVYMIMGVGIGIIDINGSNKRTLITNSGIWGYSEDGTKVFIESVDKIKEGKVVGGWMDIETGDIETGEGIEWITAIDYPANHYGHPHVNFDATMIAYDNPPLDSGDLEERNIWIGMLDDSNINYQLTEYPADSPTFANHPRWSPDGKWIVYDEQSFLEEGGVKNKVMIINIETKEKKEIYDTVVPKHSGWTEPGWSPDGKKIFFYAPDPNNDDKPSIWIAVLKEC